MNEKDMIDAWRKAEQDLGIAINSEFKIGLKNETKDVVLVEDFGGPNGTILTFDHDTKDFKELQELGYYCSALGDSYPIYDRSPFVDTLNDWGFFGPDNRKPTWYTGESWAE